MAWIKIPQEHHPIFYSALPADVTTVKMFGGVCAMVNGHMAAGLWQRSALVRVSASDQKKILAMDGGMPFDPMGNGRTMQDTVVLPEDVFNDEAELRRWMARAVAYTKTLPPKKKKEKAPAAKKKTKRKTTQK